MTAGFPFVSERRATSLPERSVSFASASVSPTAYFFFSGFAVWGASCANVADAAQAPAPSAAASRMRQGRGMVRVLRTGEWGAARRNPAALETVYGARCDRGAAIERFDASHANGL